MKSLLDICLNSVSKRIIDVFDVKICPLIATNALTHYVDSYVDLNAVDSIYGITKTAEPSKGKRQESLPVTLQDSWRTYIELKEYLRAEICIPVLLKQLLQVLTLNYRRKVTHYPIEYLLSCDHSGLKVEGMPGIPINDYHFNILSREIQSSYNSNLTKCILINSATDSLLIQLSKHCPKLKDLTIQGCFTNINDGLYSLIGIKLDISGKYKRASFVQAMEANNGSVEKRSARKSKTKAMVEIGGCSRVSAENNTSNLISPIIHKLTENSERSVEVHEQLIYKYEFLSDVGCFELNSLEIHEGPAFPPNLIIALLMNFKKLKLLSLDNKLGFYLSEYYYGVENKELKSLPHLKVIRTKNQLSEEHKEIFEIMCPNCQLIYF